MVPPFCERHPRVTNPGTPRRFSHQIRLPRQTPAVSFRTLSGATIPYIVHITNLVLLYSFSQNLQILPQLSLVPEDRFQGAVEHDILIAVDE